VTAGKSGPQNIAVSLQMIQAAYLVDPDLRKFTRAVSDHPRGKRITLLSKENAQDFLKKYSSTTLKIKTSQKSPIDGKITENSYDLQITSPIPPRWPQNRTWVQTGVRVNFSRLPDKVRDSDEEFKSFCLLWAGSAKLISCSIKTHSEGVRENKGIATYDKVPSILLDLHIQRNNNFYSGPPTLSPVGTDNSGGDKSILWESIVKNAPRYYWVDKSKFCTNCECHGHESNFCTYVRPSTGPSDPKDTDPIGEDPDYVDPWESGSGFQEYTLEPEQQAPASPTKSAVRRSAAGGPYTGPIPPPMAIADSEIDLESTTPVVEAAPAAISVAPAIETSSAPAEETSSAPAVETHAASAAIVAPATKTSVDVKSTKIPQLQNSTQPKPSPKIFKNCSTLEKMARINSLVEKPIYDISQDTRQSEQIKSDIAKLKSSVKSCPTGVPSDLWNKPNFADEMYKLSKANPATYKSMMMTLYHFSLGKKLDTPVVQKKLF
jgi:hypothetical protein